ncbi:Translationally controlled tumor protein [Penicillium paradoxum]|uniref:Translationally controlled tumor protein n=1 Tax=Penicillium paradoxum TaxID=176176 RepID=UPI0025498E5E|nr:Translationally controlled tumor protein [Penicillium paradoxum]KAJ5779936.1 Translationally controlled tumor protein [Penicillium paradoxum]
MIIYTDIVSGDEIVSDTFNLVPNKDFDVLWECDCRKYLKRSNEDFQLEGANPSAEGGDDEDGGDGEAVMVHDIEDQFRLHWLKVEDGAKPSAKAYMAHMKSYFKKLCENAAPKFAAAEDPEEAEKEFRKKCGAATKKIIKNWDNYDVLMGQSMDGDAMHVLIDFRDDGVTPYATVWADGLKAVKV